MHPLAHVNSPTASILRRTTAAAVLLLCAALIAVGCGGGDGDGGSDDPGASGIVGADGPLAWLPADTWLVASTNLDPELLDEAVTTLDRLPIWSLAEGFLPASDGPGLRRELLEQFASSATNPGSKAGKENDPKLTATQLETAFGHRVGVAITGADFQEFEGDEPPVAVWVEVDDEDAAREVLDATAEGDVSEKTYEGVDYLIDEGHGAALVRDGLLLFTPNEAQLKQLIEVRTGDSSLADDEVGRAVIEAAIGEAIGGFAVQTDPLLQAGPELARAAASRAPEDEVDDALATAEQLDELFTAKAIDALVADWIGGSATIDETGLRIREAWSNPRELADPDTGSRELVERMPADAPFVQAMASDGESIARVQDAWGELRDAYDLDLRELADELCAERERWACTFGVELALAVLEDDSLAEASRDAGDSSTVIVQNIAPLIALAARSNAAAPGGGGDDARAVPTPTLDERFFEVATAGEQVDWEPPQELTDAARDAGLVVATDAERGSFRVSIIPSSPLDRAIGPIDAETRATFAMLGIDVAKLRSRGGITLTAEEVDGMRVWGVPFDAPSNVASALRGEVETHGEAERYREVVEAADPPDEVGVYSYVDLVSFAETIIEAVGASEPDARRILPTVRNNLSDMPGALAWSTREEVDGEEVGVFETVIPLLK